MLGILIFSLFLGLLLSQKIINSSKRALNQLICLLLGFFLLNSALAQRDTGLLKNIKINGSLSVGYWFNTRVSTNAAGEKTITSTPNWFIQGAPTISIYGMQFPFTANYSNNQFSYSQPFNQYGVSPRYKWLTLHGGYRNMTFSKYSMAGVTFLGGGVDLNPGKFRFSAFYGRFAKGIEQDSNVLNTGAVLIPTYERWGYGVKIGVGTEQNHLDLIITKIKDDTASIRTPDNENIRPGDNICVGLAGKFRMFKRKVTAEFESTLSAVTNDLTVKGEIPEAKFLERFMSINYSSTINPAAFASLAYNSKYFRLGIQSEFIGPAFRTFGMYYIQNDLWRNSIKPSLRLFKGKLNLSGSIGYQTDNLFNQKATTTTRVISSGNASARLGRNLMLRANFSNFGTDQSSGLIQLNDSIRVSQINRTYGASVIYNIRGKRFFSNIVANIMSQGLDDLNVVTAQFSETQLNTATFNYNIGHKKSGLNMGIGYSISDIQNNQGNILQSGPVMRVGWSLPKYHLNVSAGLNQQNRVQNAVSDGSILSLSNNINWTIQKKHRLGVVHQQVINTSSAQSLLKQNQNRIGITYGYSF